jgi:hypothetical protein
VYRRKSLLVNLGEVETDAVLREIAQKLGVRVRRGLEGNPPPPMSPETMERIGSIFRSVERREHELIVWRLRLYCGHVVERSAHGSHLTLHSAFTGYATCPICGEEKTIVAGRAIGYAAEPPPLSRPPKPPLQRPKKATRAELEQRITELERENARLRGAHE